MSDVIVVGSGPAGMMLAGELALGGVDVAVVERRASTELIGSRAGGFHSRTIEILDQRGIADRFLSAGQTAQTARFGSAPLDIGDLPTRHPYGLGLWQNRIEPILADWIAELGVSVEHGVEVTGVSDEGEAVAVSFADGTTRRAAYVVGADGGRSLVRRAAGIGFPGWAATRSTLIAEVELTEEPPSGVVQDENGVHGLQLLEDGRTYRVVTAEPELRPSTDATLADLSASLKAAFGTDFGIHDPTWISRFTDATRQADAYRKGRILLVGDAAHIHYPAGGQGIGLGIQDAVNLGWKLGAVVTGRAPESLLDSYHAERHPADARALKLSMAQSVLQRADPRAKALDETLHDTLLTDAARHRLGAFIHGLDVAYDLGAGHPLVGRRMPDLELATPNGPTRVYELLHEARPVLLDLGADVDPAAISGRVHVLRASYDGAWELPVLGEVEAPTAVLVRPDGHVAWVAAPAGAGGPDAPVAAETLSAAIERWFGPARD